MASWLNSLASSDGVSWVVKAVSEVESRIDRALDIQPAADADSSSTTTPAAQITRVQAPAPGSPSDGTYRSFADDGKDAAAVIQAGFSSGISSLRSLSSSISHSLQQAASGAANARSDGGGSGGGGGGGTPDFFSSVLGGLGGPPPSSASGATSTPQRRGNVPAIPAPRGMPAAPRMAVAATAAKPVGHEAAVGDRPSAHDSTKAVEVVTANVLEDQPTPTSPNAEKTDVHAGSANTVGEATAEAATPGAP
ncbi:hypothetical protein HK405_008927, partial [Cladochytrium tenue]